MTQASVSSSSVVPSMGYKRERTRDGRERQARPQCPSQALQKTSEPLDFETTLALSPFLIHPLPPSVPTPQSPAAAPSRKRKSPAPAFWLDFKAQASGNAARRSTATLPVSSNWRRGREQGGRDRWASELLLLLPAVSRGTQWIYRLKPLQRRRKAEREREREKELEREGGEAETEC